MTCCSNAKSWWNAEFRVDDRLWPCKHISLELPSPIFIVGLSTRVGEQPNCYSTCFSGCELFFAIRLYNSNDSQSWHVRFAFLAQWLECCALEARDCQFWSKQCAFALVAKARQHFLNLRNPNHLFPSSIIDCLREAKSFLQIECANESSFAKAYTTV